MFREIIFSKRILQTILLVFLTSAGPSTACLPAPITATQAGTFSGSYLTSYSNLETYLGFRGIPYAKPPIGDKRFAKPEPYPQILGVFDAKEFGPSCVQPKGRRDKGQEDCLTINVFTPLCERGSGHQEHLKKVLVFIHGGALVLGSSTPYLPGDLVTREDVVVVTLNYRLGWLGYLRGNTDELPGNQFLWDVLLALNWVKDNIRGFKGDPNDVTLSGESVGSLISSVLSVSPLAKGLFNRAILMSLVGMHFPTQPRTSNDLLRLAAQQLDCERGDNHTTTGITDDRVDTSETVACLKSIKNFSFDRQPDTISYRALISSGDEILPRSLSEAAGDPEYLAEVGFYSRDYILSGTKDDGLILVNSDFTKIDTTSKSDVDFFMTNLLNESEDAGQKALAPYRQLYNHDDEKALSSFLTDLFIVKGNVDFAKIFNTPPSVQLSGRAYLMSFDHEPQYIRDSYMLHALDLCYLFDTEPDTLLELFYGEWKVTGEFRDEDYKLKALFLDVMADFIKTGDPTPTLARNHSITWLPTQRDSNPYISFSTHPSMGDDLLQRRWTTGKNKRGQEQQKDSGKLEL